MGWDKDSLVGKAKPCTSKAKQGIPVCTWMFSHFQESQTPSWISSALGRQTASVWIFPLPPLSLYHWVQNHMAWDIPLIRQCLLSHQCPLPISCAFPACWLMGWSQKQRNPWCSVSTAKQQLKHQHCFDRQSKI